MIQIRGDEWCDDPVLIKEGAVQFFRTLFASNAANLAEWPLRGCFPGLSSMIKEQLTRAVIDDKVLVMVKICFVQFVVLKVV
ncbi:hypothetical protein V6N13_043775 [Hibiscus sabdariffa]